MFKLPFDIQKATDQIKLKDPILLIGSCFSDEIGTKLKETKLTSLNNPFGTVYNPYSIFRLLMNQIDEEDIIKSQGVYFHWDTHGIISSLNKGGVQKKLNEKREETQNFLRDTKWLIITLGTAIIYEFEDKRIVANCHKIPDKNFKKRFLSQTEIINSFEDLVKYLDHLRLDLNIIFTISPVRHIKDGLIENNRSKSILIDAVHSICEVHDNTMYFPSYEIVIDELRDYRFYANDMVHPSAQAVDYVWSKFSETFFDPELMNFLKEWQSIRSALNHRPFQPDSEGHQKFLRKILSKLEKLNGMVDVSVELEQIKSKIK